MHNKLEGANVAKKYDKLDSILIASIGEVPKMFGAIHVGETAKECERIAANEGNDRTPFGVSPFRICDRRLQYLRKAGKIKSTTKGWILR